MFLKAWRFLIILVIYLPYIFLSSKILLFCSLQIKSETKCNYEEVTILP